MIRINHLGKNQLEIMTENGSFFQSYETLVGMIEFKTDKIVIREGQPQSKTTAKYMYKWLNRTAKEYKQAVKNGNIVFVKYFTIY